MKTIAFRIWDKENKKFFLSGSTPSMLKSFFEITAVLNTRDEMPYQQYTGLSDKNQAWIYEGDIVKVYSPDDEYLCTQKVEWAEVGGYFCDEDTGNCRPPLGDGDEINLEVIGNIYEHKHLLDNTDAKV